MCCVDTFNTKVKKRMNESTLKFNKQSKVPGKIIKAIINGNGISPTINM